MNTTFIRRFLFLSIGIVAALALYDAVRAPDDGPYRKIPHGDHVHYVPKNKDPEAHLDAFPTKLPPPGFEISPTGEVVKIP